MAATAPKKIEHILDVHLLVRRRHDDSKVPYWACSGCDRGFGDAALHLVRQHFNKHLADLIRTSGVT